MPELRVSLPDEVRVARPQKARDVAADDEGLFGEGPGGEGAGLRVLKEDTEGQSLAAPLKSSSFSAKQKGKK